MTRHIDAAGREAIKRFESCRLEAYRDAVGVWTIGWGSTHGVHAGMTITQDEAERRFADDLAPAETAVGQLVKVPLTDGQFAALVSFTFNCGAGTLRTSSLLRLLNGGGYAAVPAELRRFCFAHGRRLQGLATRREAEVKLWLAAPAPADPHPDKPAAPVAAAPASPAATEQTHGDQDPMSTTSNATTLVTEAEKAGVDAIAGLTNFFGNIGAQVSSAATVAASGKTTTAAGAAIPAAATASAANAPGFVAAVEQLVADAEAGKWTSEAKDVIDLLVTGMALATKFGVTVPGLSILSTMLPTIEAIL